MLFVGFTAGEIAILGNKILIISTASSQFRLGNKILMISTASNQSEQFKFKFLKKIKTVNTAGLTSVHQKRQENLII